MTDYASQYALGEDIDGSSNGGSEVKPVNYTETIAMGNPLHIHNVNQTNDVPDVQTASVAADQTRYIAIHDGEAGQIKSALHRGRTKIQLGGTVTAGLNLEVTTSGLFIQSAGTNPIVGYALQSGDNGDLIQIYFDGVKA